jgi:hypothetical protein
MIAFDQWKKDWRAGQRTPSFFELVNIFGPACYSAANQSLRNRITQAKQEIKNTQTAVDDMYQTMINPAPYGEKHNLIKAVHDFYGQWLAEAEQIIKRSSYRLNHIRRLRKRHLAEKRGTTLPADNPNHLTEADIEQAKAVPIATLYQGKLRQFGDRAVGLCPFHSETRPSFYIFQRKNTWYCFSCNTGRDAPDFVMKQQNVDFIQAVKILINKN